jgi:hypothetical protein
VNLSEVLKECCCRCAQSQRISNTWRCLKVVIKGESKKSFPEHTKSWKSSGRIRPSKLLKNTVMEVVTGSIKKASQVCVQANKFSRRNTWFISQKLQGGTDGRNSLRMMREFS